MIFNHDLPNFSFLPLFIPLAVAVPPGLSSNPRLRTSSPLLPGAAWLGRDLKWARREVRAGRAPGVGGQLPARTCVCTRMYTRVCAPCYLGLCPCGGPSHVGCLTLCFFFFLERADFLLTVWALKCTFAPKNLTFSVENICW